MPTFYYQDIDLTNSRIFDNTTFSVNTWYKLTTNLNKREYITFRNQGVSMNMSTGNVFIMASNTAGVTTISVNNPQVYKLKPNTEYKTQYGKDIVLSVRSDTANTCLRVEEIDGRIGGGPFDTAE